MACLISVARWLSLCHGRSAFGGPLISLSEQRWRKQSLVEGQEESQGESDNALMLTDGLNFYAKIRCSERNPCKDGTLQLQGDMNAQIVLLLRDMDRLECLIPPSVSVGIRISWRLECIGPQIVISGIAVALHF